MIGDEDEFEFAGGVGGEDGVEGGAEGEAAGSGPAGNGVVVVLFEGEVGGEGLGLVPFVGGAGALAVAVGEAVLEGVGLVEGGLG